LGSLYILEGEKEMSEIRAEISEVSFPAYGGPYSDEGRRIKKDEDWDLRLSVFSYSIG
jgi:hypothetical protein